MSNLLDLSPSIVQSIRSLYSVDLLDNPFPNYHLVREFEPIKYEQVHDTWVFTRYADVVRILKDPLTFSSKKPITFTSASEGSEIVLFSNAPPKHTGLRSLIKKSFNTNSIEDLKPWMETTVASLVADFSASYTDVASLLTTPLPVMVIAKLLGVPTSDWEQLKSWTETGIGNKDSGTQRHGPKAYVEMFQYFKEQTKIKRREPKEDIISLLATSKVDGNRLTDMEILNFCTMLLIAGSETTSSLMSNMLNILATRPQLWKRLRDDRSVVEPVIEETLRYDSPAQFFSRKVTSPVCFGDRRFEPGTLLTVCIGAANRDPEVFTNPDDFNPNRPEKRHLAFSHGIHYCVGAALSRLEAGIVLNYLLDCYGSIARAGTGTRYPNLVLRGFKHLPLNLC